jgi:hypothetical protein
MGVFNIVEMTKEQNQIEPDTKIPEKIIETTKVNETENIIKNKEDKLITLNGNLSQIYTDALNQMYAIENMGSMFNIINSVSDQKETSDDLYVHIVDSDDLENIDPIKIVRNLRLALDKRTETTKLLVLESNNLTAKIIGDYFNIRGIKSIYNRDNALQTIRNYLS